MNDSRHSRGLITDILDVLDKHGYHPAGHQHTGRAIGLIAGLARSCQGTQEAPPGHGLHQEPPAEANAAPGQHAADDNAVTVGPADTKIILAALDEAADIKRDRAANCPDCDNRSCGTCEYRLRTARAYDRTAARLRAARQARKPAAPDHRPAPNGRPHACRQRQARPKAEAGR